jgi:hypothetical protein
MADDDTASCVYPELTCEDRGGYICELEEYCLGNQLAASDTDRCCDDHHEYGCEECYGRKVKYEIIIPKEEPKFISGQFFLERADEVIVIHRPKQETLEEVAERLLRDHRDFEVEGDSSYQNGRLNGILEGLKYQSERMYSEEEVRKAFAIGMDYYSEPNVWDKVSPKQKLENLLIKKQ